MPHAIARALSTALSERQVSLRESDRRAVSTDQSAAALLRYRQRLEPELPLCVVSPENVQEVVHVVRIAREHGVGIVAYGAGSGVSGGAMAEARAITVDFKRMRRVLRLDQDRLVVEAEAGIIGEHLEAHLRRHGLTLGHFPASITSSTLGGWLATRSAGQLSSRYGKIDDMALALRAVDGRASVRTLEAESLPGFLGSEGRLGLICDATLRVWPKAEAEHYWGFEVQGMAHGFALMRALLHEGFSPTVLRLGNELDASLALTKESDVAWPKSLWAALKRHSLAALLMSPDALRFAGARLPAKCTLIVGCEGKTELAEAMIEGMRAHCARLDARDLGKEAGLAWYYGRYHAAYKQSPLFALGAYVDTLEIRTAWDRANAVEQAVRDALGDRAFVMAHAAHADLDGCTLGFSFIAMETNDDAAHHQESRQRALEAATAAGGRAAHGVSWDELCRLERAWDPDRLFNREKQR